MKNQKNVTLRISDDLLEKLYFVAKDEGRTLNNQILLMARNAVAYYEKTKGKITPDKLKNVREKMHTEIVTEDW